MTASTKSIADVLDAAADLIAAPGAWTQFPSVYERGSARDADGKAFYAPSRKAVCWCIYGAISQIAGTDRDLSYKASRAIETDSEGVSSWNDALGRTQEEVVAKLREAAAKARAEQVA
jgi:hypothetical protein